MDEVINYLTKEKISVFSVVLPDGSSHSATLHFSHNSDPLTLYFSTEKSSRKCQGLTVGATTPASVVVGFSEEEWITLQMDGQARLLSADELEQVQSVHYAKHPGSAKFKDDPETVFIAFVPTWWRYTDYTTNPATIHTS